MLNDPNSNEQSKSNGRVYSDNNTNFGWFGIRPGFLQIWTKPIVTLLLLFGCSSTHVLLQHLLPAVERTLKRRYDLSDKDVSGLQLAQGISCMVTVILVGYFGSFRKSKIRCIAAGMVISGLGAVFFSIPHYRSDAYEPGNFPKQALMMFGICRFPPTPCNDAGVESKHMSLFVIGQILIGVGLAPLYCLVPAYIDENVRPKWMPVTMTVYYAFLSLGPVMGFAVAGVFQQAYIDIDQPDLLHPVDSEDNRWLGAWWLGFLVFGLITMVNAILVSGLPPSLPGSRATRDEHVHQGNIPTDDAKITPTPSGALHATTSLLKNKAYLFNTLASLCIIFFFYAIGPFMIQVVVIKYGAGLLKILMPVMIALILGLLVGITIGGYLTCRINLKNIAKGAALLCLATQALCILAPLLFVIPGCNESNIAGVTKEYPALGGKVMKKMGRNGSSEITATCNKHCGCSTYVSQPVCGSNNVAYFDPCHAGCQFTLNGEDYLNCTCVPSSIPGMKFGTAKKGYCDRGCASWKAFIFVTFLAVVLLGANIVPNRVVVLRCVQNNQRSYALAVQQFLAILVAFIPTHLVKYIMNHDCHIWQKDPCGRKGICWDYDTNSMTKSMTIFGLVVTALATACYFFSWYTYEAPKVVKTNRLLSDTSNPPDDADDGKETKL